MVIWLFKVHAIKSHLQVHSMKKLTIRLNKQMQKTWTTSISIHVSPSDKGSVFLTFNIQQMSS